MARAPLRISLAGGGTDFPEFYIGRGASWVSAAINKYCYSALNFGYAEEFLIKYSKLERVRKFEDVEHNLIRECLKFLKQDSPLEMTFSADIPGGTGLGSSGAFTVSLLSALHAFRGNLPSQSQIAQEATHIEREILREPIGLQDQYIAAVGGTQVFDVDKEGNLTWRAFNPERDWSQRLQEHIMLIYTGKSRKASEILKTKKSRLSTGETSEVRLMEWITATYSEACDFLRKLDIHNYGHFLNEYWLLKKSTDSRMSDNQIDELYEHLMESGCLGGKLIGAGGGGFLMLVVDNKRDIRKNLGSFSKYEVPFNFEFSGSTIVFRD